MDKAKRISRLSQWSFIRFAAAAGETEVITYKILPTMFPENHFRTKKTTETQKWSRPMRSHQSPSKIRATSIICILLS